MGTRPRQVISVALPNVKLIVFDGKKGKKKIIIWLSDGFESSVVREEENRCMLMFNFIFKALVD
jgi:hypothetical protein